jgi:hypothetical protein
MTTPAFAVETLRRVFEDGFSAADIGEPLVSFDAESSANEVRALMEARNYEVVGIREAGLMTGFVMRDDLASGICRPYMRTLDEAEVFPGETSLADTIQALDRRRFVFLVTLGAVGGIVTRSDLQKPAVRMWLFGIVTLIEMRFSRLIQTQLCEEEWQACLSEQRLAKAESLLAERRRRNQDLDLIDCLQFADKVQIVARTERLRAMTRFASRRKLEEAARAMESLRNNLAHAQDIIATDWATIVLLAENLHNVLLGPPGMSKEGDDQRGETEGLILGICQE